MLKIFRRKNAIPDQDRFAQERAFTKQAAEAHAAAIENWTRQAGKNDALAAFNLSYLYLKSIWGFEPAVSSAKTATEIVKSNPEKALHWLSLAANNGHTGAQYIIGLLHYQNLRRIVRQKRRNAVSETECDEDRTDFTEAAKWLRKAADSGYVNAQSCLGYLYRSSSEADLTKPDTNEAVSWFRKAAENGNYISQIEMGDRYAAGQGVVKDEVEAARWYRMAVGRCVGGAYSERAAIALGCLYAAGDGMDQNLTEASRLFTFAAERHRWGREDGYNLKGYEGDYEFAEALHMEVLAWLCNSAVEGWTVASSAIALMYRTRQPDSHLPPIPGDWFVIRNLGRHPEIIERLSIAAEKGDPKAQFILAFTGASNTSALAWLEKAASQHLVPAARLLGGIYEEGYGTPKDQIQSAKYYRIAAELGDAIAQYEVGRSLVVATEIADGPTWRYYSFTSGQYVMDNKLATEAAIWYTMAAEQGHAQSQLQLAALYLDGFGVEKATVKGLALLQQAAIRGYPNAQFALAEAYGSGVYVDQNDELKRRWYREAAIGGHGGALEKLATFDFHADSMSEDNCRIIYDLLDERAAS